MNQVSFYWGFTDHPERVFQGLHNNIKDMARIFLNSWRIFFGALIITVLFDLLPLTHLFDMFIIAGVLAHFIHTNIFPFYLAEKGFADTEPLQQNRLGYYAFVSAVAMAFLFPSNLWFMLPGHFIALTSALQRVNTQDENGRKWGRFFHAFRSTFLLQIAFFLYPAVSQLAIAINPGLYVAVYAMYATATVFTLIRTYAGIRFLQYGEIHRDGIRGFGPLLNEWTKVDFTSTLGLWARNLVCILPGAAVLAFDFPFFMHMVPFISWLTPILVVFGTLAAVAYAHAILALLHGIQNAKCFTTVFQDMSQNDINRAWPHNNNHGSTYEILTAENNAPFGCVDSVGYQLNKNFVLQMRTTPAQFQNLDHVGAPPFTANRPPQQHTQSGYSTAASAPSAPSKDVPPPAYQPLYSATPAGAASAPSQSDVPPPAYDYLPEGAAGYNPAAFDAVKP